MEDRTKYRSCCGMSNLNQNGQQYQHSATIFANQPRVK